MRTGLCQYAIRAIVLIPIFLNKAAEPAAKPIHPKGGKPAAFIVAFEEYKKKLEFPLDSAIALAIELSNCGYNVTLITDAPGVATAQVELNVSNNSNKQVYEAKSAEEVEQRRKDWLKTHFQGQTKVPFGLVILSGHGESRDGNEFFLTPTDQSKQGGIGIHNLQEEIGSQRLPIVLIVDCCRDEPDSNQESLTKSDNTANTTSPAQTEDTGVSLPEVEKAIQTAGKRVKFGQRKGTMEDDHAKWPVLTVTATRPLKPAIDMTNDLLKSLAVGLRDPEGRPAFEAKVHSTILDEFGGRKEREQDISFRVLFHYATQRVSAASQGTQSVEVSPGFIDQSMIIAARDGNYPTQFPIDLLTGWRDFADGGLKVDLDSSRNVKITRTKETGAKSVVASSFVDVVEKIDGTTISVEVYATPNAGQVHLAQGIHPLFQPCDHTVPIDISQFFKRWNVPCHIPYHKATQINVLLDNVPQGGRLTTMTVSTDPNNVESWPIGSSLFVTRMVLYPKEYGPAKPIVSFSTSSFNLMSRWWISDAIKISKETTVFFEFKGESQNRNPAVKVSSQQSLEHHQVFKLNVQQSGPGSLGGAGGPIYPEIPLGVAKFKFEVVVKSFKPAKASSKSAKVLALFQAKGTTVASVSFDINKSQIGKPNKFDIVVASGVPSLEFVDYLALSTDAEELELDSIKVVPERK